MEKKGSRNLQPSRGLPSDSKKNQDGTSKLWPRGSRRRETNGGSLSVKPDPSRKPQPQRVKTLDKRPKPRSSYGSSVARNEAARLEDELEVELGSVFLPGSKKQSLNHLLNFVYAPRESFQSGREHGQKGNGNKLMLTKKHRYNKEHFLQANCQFIVNEAGDYKQYMNNPDALVDWNLIEQVNVQVSEIPSCPICLYSPVAAKITRCGHIYCWSCILHYLALSDKPWRKCPICYEAVHRPDLKSVVSVPHQSFNVNETITFKLMKRARGSLTAYPIDAYIKENVIFRMFEMEASSVYSKLLLANATDIKSIIDRESKELNQQLIEDEDCVEKCFIEQAIQLLKERDNLNCGGVQTVEDHANVIEKGLEDLKLNENVGESQKAEEASALDSNQPAKFHYFYQASDGQHIYLHAINARMLEHTYGSLEFGPRSITGKILEKEGGSMTEELRKRLRYLQHLPVTCQFEVAEVQLKQPNVSKETIDYFKDQVEIRRRKRQRRAKEEKKREKRITEEENRKIGNYPTPILHIESHHQFPDFKEMEARLRSESEGTLPSERSSSPDMSFGTPSSSLPTESECSGPSFAKMLATKKTTPPSWPGLKKQPTDPVMPVKLINVTGSNMKMKRQTRGQSDSENEPEDYQPVPAFNASFSDAIAQALEKVEKFEDIDASVVGKKKKKKNKQTVLFATTMAYSGN